jgi:RHS repeat-associated protein
MVTVGSAITRTKYAGDFIYEKTGTGADVLVFFNTPEGYVEPVNASNYGSGFNYVYQYKDHLGNIRLSYKDINQNNASAVSLQIQEENNYYPFGLKHKGYNTSITGRHHKYMFGGKELQDEIVGSSSFEVYDFGARNYDAALGRWMNLDPLAEKMRRHSPYNYAFNNPIYFIDPDGMAPIGPDDPPSKNPIKKLVDEKIQEFGKFVETANRVVSTMMKSNSDDSGSGNTFNLNNGVNLNGDKSGWTQGRKADSNSKVESWNVGFLVPLSQAFGPGFENKIAQGLNIVYGFAQEFFGDGENSDEQKTKKDPLLEPAENFKVEAIYDLEGDGDLSTIGTHEQTGTKADSIRLIELFTKDHNYNLKFVD